LQKTLLSCHHKLKTHNCSVTPNQQQPPIEGTDPSMMNQEKRSQLFGMSPHSPATDGSGSLTLTASASYSSSEASRSVASKPRLGLDPESSACAVLPQKKSFRSRRPLAIETSWDTMTTADDPSSCIQHPPTPNNSARQYGQFFDPSPRSVLDSSSSTQQFF
jgi:hypothetical protein